VAGQGRTESLKGTAVLRGLNPAEIWIAQQIASEVQVDLVCSRIAIIREFGCPLK
jgi:hypothetical protein